MHDAESRALRRTALLLLAVSLVRWGWPEPAPDPPGAQLSNQLLDSSRSALGAADRRAKPLGPGERLDPNRATAEQLDRLPGIGAGAATEIVAHRERAGPFRVPGDLTDVRGIGDATLEKIRPHLEMATMPTARAPVRRVGPRRVSARIDINTADAARLTELPGVGPALAARIVERRADRPFVSVDDLETVRGIGPATLSRLRPLVTVGRGRREE